MPEQCFVRHADDDGTVVIELRDEQAVFHERLDQPSYVLRGFYRQMCPLAADRLVDILLDAHEQIENLGKFALDLDGKRFEHSLGTLRQRAFNTAQLAVGTDRQHAVLGSALVQLFQCELQERQYFRVTCRGIAQHVVEAFAGRRVLLEPQASGARRQPDHLADLVYGRRHQVVLTRSFL